MFNREEREAVGNGESQWWTNRKNRSNVSGGGLHVKTQQAKSAVRNKWRRELTLIAFLRIRTEIQERS